ncbi:methyltransferase domain-containing protein [Salinibacterium sp. SWN248]|uniref:methyltransferase domain-containing protein n=1 Tax=Salinibacterium sp. SWN248 TaxID=2792056 RepID=UPI0018CF2516|nr:methyltransferase domain-containing protein [Salinibacterium sp. SWN248]MBH0023861.1 methyltransferase domain-containing protein [Salinibacterium sp. SWN248]
MTSERYTHGHHESVLKSHTWRTIANSAAYFEPRLEAGLSLLDIGCGPGTITAEFAERLAPGRVVGLDAASAAIKKASAFTADNLSFVMGDAYALPFDDNSFDLVHSHQTLQHLGDPVAALVEMKRVAKPGGLIAVRDVDYAGTICFPEPPGLKVWADLYDAVHRSNGGEPNAGRRLKSWAMQAGLADVATSASIWNFSDEVDREWWGSMWEARVLESAFAADALGKSLATQDVLQQISDAWREWADSPEGWMAMPHGEILARV